jgi:hypothetical protein
MPAIYHRVPDCERRPPDIIRDESGDWIPAENQAGALLVQLADAMGGSTAEPTSSERDEQAIVSTLEAMIADLGGAEVGPNPEAEADALLARLAAWTG